MITTAGWTVHDIVTINKTDWLIISRYSETIKRTDIKLIAIRNAPYKSVYYLQYNQKTRNLILSKMVTVFYRVEHNLVNILENHFDIKNRDEILKLL